MEQEQVIDVANEPVDRNTSKDFMDTGVLHEGRLCTACGEKPAAKGSAMCTGCVEQAQAFVAQAPGRRGV